MKSDQRQRLLVMLAGAVVALFLGDRLILTPLAASWRQRSTRVVELRKKVTEGQSLLQREASLRSRWSQMRSNTLANTRSLAEEQVLNAFDRWSQASRVSLLSINPQWKQEGEDYLTLECRVEASGGLPALSRFLYDIERDSLPFRLQSVELSSRDNEGQQLALGLQISGLVLTPNKTEARR